MAGIACRHIVFATEYYIKRLVGIAVAFQATLQFKVCFPFVALGTLGDYLFLGDKGGMPTFVTIKTAHLCFVFSTSFLVFVDNFGMALNTVAVLELGFRLGVCTPAISHRKR